MSANPGIEIKGLNKLVKELGKIDPTLKTELKDTNKALAQSVVPVARGLAPSRSGRLEASVRAGATARSGVVKAGKASVPYAKPIHFGWPKRNIKPQPFLYEALDSRKEEVMNAWEQKIQEVLDRV